MSFTVTSLVDWAIDEEIGDIVRFEYEDILNARSGWTLVVPSSPGRFDYWNRSGTGVRVVDNGYAWAGYTKRVVDNLGTITISGNAGICLWADRIPIPEPLNLTGPWSTIEAIQITGDAVGVFANLLSQAGGLDNARRNPGAHQIRAVGVSGLTLSGSWRWSPHMLAAIEEFATATNVKVRTWLPPGDGAAWETSIAVLREVPSVVFDRDLGHDVRPIITGEPEGDPEAGTNVYVGGSGEGTERIIRTVTTTGGARRIERWVEDRSEDTAELDSAGQAVADLAAPSLTMEIASTDTPGMTYGTDYVVGDVASIRVGGHGKTSARVARMFASLGSGGLARTVTVGDGRTSLITSDSARRRLGRLEGA